MKILIVGAGYVGSHFAEHTKTLGWDISLTTTSPEKIPFLGHLGNIYLWNSSQSADHLPKADIILVAVAPKDSNYENTYLKTAHAIAKYNAQAHIIYVSSTGVYGEHNGATVTEDTLCHGENPSLQILIDTEQVYLNSCPTSTILRLGEIYGPGREIEQRLRKVNGGAVPGTGENVTNLSSLETILNAIQFVIENKLYGIFNVVEDAHMTRKELYNLLCEKHNIPNVQWSGAPSGHGGNKLVSNQKLKNLGF